MIISSSEDFFKAKAFISSVFNIERELPNQVFKSNFSHFTFEEFNWTEEPEFWDTSIKELSRVSGDTDIVIMIIDPSLRDYYLKTFNFYLAFKIPLTFTGEDYSKELHSGPKERAKDIPFIYSESVAWVPLSRKWAIWGQRAYGTCVLAFADKKFVIPDESLKGTWRSAKEALETFISLSYRNQQVPANHSAAFLSNYSNQ